MFCWAAPLFLSFHVGYSGYIHFVKLLYTLLYRERLVTPGQDGGPDRHGGVEHDHRTGIPDTNGAIRGTLSRLATGSVFGNRSATIVNEAAKVGCKLKGCAEQAPLPVYVALLPQLSN